MQTTTTKTRSKVNTEKEQLLKRILRDKKTNQHQLCETNCVSN
ncbi:hypothetical protein MATR_25130 [Marivirga tractuosa]|uniref:Uncharacterized protein n=1 Tax=Marivirga tractuosa (strain ATCC 23168 / DSM 4126 / NBRC 15989 / NCIMB 1408 / VKM B-1430 / H-43) TaxID=643867 RepID=E4TPU4_MARTH|nr:hypothetical protein Ftrac_3662 [Marivirga tractuosa DSM 4126]BDD15688.1 hypothetical protein MATR_25130 [Marivirga tractuosa]